MKFPFHTALFIFSLLVFVACKKNTPDNVFDCQSLRTAMINEDKAIVEKEINFLCADLEPYVTPDDEFGQRDNLDKLAQRLSTDCDFDASVECYNCLLSYPPQSVLSISIISAGMTITHTINIGYTTDKHLKFSSL